MTAAFLQSELSTLIADSKRKYNDVRASAENALAEIKSISVTSETQLASDLIRRPQFIDTFILACKSKNIKLASSGTICLQRLTASRAIPPTRLGDVLDVFHDVLSLGFDIQLKILQTLPSLLQLYSSELYGSLLAATLDLCAALESSKTSVINKTAAATFQQLVTAVFKQASENQHNDDKKNVNLESDENLPQQLDSGAILEDAENLFWDLCALTNRDRPKFLQCESLSLVLLLDVVHSILEDFAEFLRENDSINGSIKDVLMPALLELLSSKDHFSLVVRLLRIAQSLTHKFLSGAETQLLPILRYLLNAIDRDNGPLWKRAACLEFFEDVCSDFGLVRQLFESYDSQDGSRSFITDLMASFVRIAAEDASLIGLGRQSTIPTQKMANHKENDIAAIEAQGIGGGLASVTSADGNATGISLDWSRMEIPLLDQLESKSPPTIPSTYIYTLILGCISSFADGLSKYIMPLSVSGRRVHESPSKSTEEAAHPEKSDHGFVQRTKRSFSATSDKHQRLMNPLTFPKNPQTSGVETCSKMIDSCWPAILATCSTFLNAALDSHFYHILIRSAQKLAQVSGVLDLSTPRDALLTSLAKSAVPPTISMIIANSQSKKISVHNAGAAGDKFDTASLKSPGLDVVKNPFDSNMQALNVRHLLCLRALINLGIALGPSLGQDSWFIIIETLQQVEALISISSASRPSSAATTPRIGYDAQDGQSTLSAEMNAMQIAAKRMMESSKGFSNDSIKNFISAIFKLIGPSLSEDKLETENGNMSSPTFPSANSLERRTRQSSRNVSGLWQKSRTLSLEMEFVLTKTSELARINLHRFASVSSFPVSWDLVATKLLEIAKDDELNDETRLRAARIVDIIAVETVKLLDTSRQTGDAITLVQSKCLKALSAQLNDVRDNAVHRTEVSESFDLEMQKRLLEALEDIVGHCGESIAEDWSLIFDILDVTCQTEKSKISLGDNKSNENDARVTDLLATAFKCVHLISSDFLTNLNNPSIARLTQLLGLFGTDIIDLNIALTTTNLIRSVASLLLDRFTRLNLSDTAFSDASSETFSGETPDNETTLLWTLNLSKLIKICRDQRQDVRNAAVQVLLQVLDAASDALTSDSWQIILREAPISLLEAYQKVLVNTGEEVFGWDSSLVNLMKGMVELLTRNIQNVAADRRFIDTWASFISVLDSTLQATQIPSSIVFTSLSNLLEAMSQIRQLDPRLIERALRLWATYHPGVDDDAQSEHPTPNEENLAAHSHVFVMAYRASSSAARAFSYQNRAIVELLMTSVQLTILKAIHSPYSSDVRKLSPEQQEVSSILHVLNAISKTENDFNGFTIFLLDLIRKTVLEKDMESQVEVSRTQLSSNVKEAQKPTFIAFVSHCVIILRDLIQDRAEDKSFLHDLAAQQSFQILAKLISSKYSGIPVNADQPLWKTSTSTAVLLLENVRRSVQANSNELENNLAEPIARAICTVISSNLNAGGLESKMSVVDESTVVKDELFDIDQFQRAHAAAIPILVRSNVNDETQKQYVIELFQASLIAKPWFYDFPKDLLSNPLSNLNSIRLGSVHTPVFPRRLQICYVALEALFNLVRRIDDINSDQKNTKDIDHHIDEVDSKGNLQSVALPYLILRIAHPIKTFLADQYLRGLTPPPMYQQIELAKILNMALDLRCSGYANLNFSVDHVQPSSKDGKIHLRVLYPLILKLQSFWLQKLPRLEGAAWQDDEHGKGIEKAILSWSEIVGEGWSI